MRALYLPLPISQRCLEISYPLLPSLSLSASAALYLCKIPLLSCQVSSTKQKKQEIIVNPSFFPIHPFFLRCVKRWEATRSPWEDLEFGVKPTHFKLQLCYLASMCFSAHHSSLLPSPTESPGKALTKLQSSNWVITRSLVTFTRVVSIDW